MGADKNGDESCNGMVAGWNTVLRGSGVCPGENTRVIQNEKQPGYGHMKMGGYARDEKHKPGNYG